MDKFWKNWAAQEARMQWLIYYRDKGLAPKVDTVEVLEDEAAFLVTFEGGDTLRVSPLGLAQLPRPVGMPRESGG